MTIASRPPAWLRRQFPVTPPTAVVALDDWKHQDRKSVWYDSRYYRLNMFWENGGFYIRDLHRFDETVVSPTHATVLTNTSLAYGTLPVMDGCLWSGPDPAGLRPVLLSPAGAYTALTPAGPPVVTELTRTELEIRQPLPDGGMFTIVCGETQVTFSGVDAQARPFAWAWNLIGGAKQKAALQSVTPHRVTYHVDGATYQLRLAPAGAVCRQLPSGDLQLQCDPHGKPTLQLGGF